MPYTRFLPFVMSFRGNVASGAVQTQVADTEFNNNLDYDFEILEASLEAYLADNTAVADLLWRVNVEDQSKNMKITKQSTPVVMLTRADTQRWDLSQETPEGRRGHILPKHGGKLLVYVDNNAGAQITVHLALHGFLLSPA